MKITVDIVTTPRPSQPLDLSAAVSDAGVTATLTIDNRLKLGPIIRRLAVAIEGTVSNISAEVAAIQPGDLFAEGERGGSQ